MQDVGHVWGFSSRAFMDFLLRLQARQFRALAGNLGSLASRLGICYTLWNISI